VVQDKVYIFAQDDVMWRFWMSYGFASLSLSVVFALSFLFSALVENAIGPIIATMAVIIVFMIITILNFELLNAIKPYLFVTHMVKWREFMRDPVDYGSIINSGLVLLAHIIIFFGATLIIFNKKDILT
jgi:ABC-2 type transport system permease protein